MKKLKKMLSVILACCMFFISIPTASAMEVEKKFDLDTEEGILSYLESSPTATTVSEYDIWKEQKEEATVCLERQTISAQERVEAQRIMDFDPVEHFYELKDKGEEYLRENGYTETQIEAIMAFDGSESSIYRASAKLTADLMITSKNSTSSQNKFTAKYVFSWSGTPSFCFTDLVAIVSEYFYFTSGNSTVYYRTEQLNEDIGIDFPTTITRKIGVKAMEKCNGHAGGIDLPMTYVESIGNLDVVYNARTGNVTANFNSVDFHQTAVSGTYAHKTVSFIAEPTMSIGLKGLSPNVKLDLKINWQELAYETLVVAVS